MLTMTENRLDLEMFPRHLINPKSKWYTLEKLIPWRELEELPAPLLGDCGRNAIPVRHIIGALIVQTEKNLSDLGNDRDHHGDPIENFVYLGNNTVLDLNVLVNYGALIGHDVQIGSHSVISPGAIINGGVEIGEKAFIGSGAMIKQSLTIGRNSVVGMGAVVTQDVPADSVYIGNPARRLRENKGNIF